MVAAMPRCTGEWRHPGGGGLGGPYRRVSEMQAKLHCWVAADAGRRFDDLFNLVHDPATLTALLKSRLKRMQ
jgi:hypothetical protein